MYFIETKSMLAANANLVKHSKFETAILKFQDGRDGFTKKKL